MGISDVVRCSGPVLTISSPVSPEAEFWTWFAANESMLLDVEHDTDHVVEAIFLRLMRVDTALAFDVGPERDGRRQFVVSACGDPLAFPAVLKLVSAAPPLERWTITAFRPRREAKGSFELHGGGMLDLETVRFAAEPAEGRLDVTLFIPAFRRALAEEYEVVGLLLMDIVLGELDVMTRLGEVSVAPLQPGVESRPLAELPAVVDALPAN
jgi:hypothetical protein